MNTTNAQYYFTSCGQLTQLTGTIMKQHTRQGLMQPSNLSTYLHQLFMPQVNNGFIPDANDNAQ